MGLYVDLVMLHGSETDKTYFGDDRFFSELSDFSSDYGEVKRYRVSLGNVFDIGDRDDCNRLVELVGELVDPYDGGTYRTFDELERYGLLGMDTWEISENYVRELRGMGYDGIVLYEGGVFNVMVFDSMSYVLVD